ncbi:MAG: UDP-4-amino-4,6-dideoxy-N-acetyl-beta-L-altrosamine transaminase [Candidatus Omnitrophica bacterium]|nr:UDP-4-amino-4,6-dideoxy-N-acetyl-beta-L-altrosamine transaminase [Candidatus Omnitrophota bacterium]
MRYIPYGRQSIGQDDLREVTKVLKSDWITQGPKIKEFEEGLCRYTQAKYATAVSSGTAALHIAALAAGIKQGDEVITSPITFVASANAALYCGARPVFADIEKATGNIDTEKISRKITKKTKAIIPVHFAGHPCDLEKIKAIAKKNNLIIIEDACHALGAEYKGIKIGSCRHSDMAVLSFHPVKAITTGEGGAVLTNSKDYYKKLIMFRNHGLTKENLEDTSQGDWYYEMQYLGYNYRITDIQTCLGISQLKKLDSFIRKRRKIAAFYDRAFKGNGYFDIPAEKEYAFSAYHLYPIILKKVYACKRKEFFSKMRARGFGVQVHYIPVYLQPYYKRLGYAAGLCPLAESFYNRQISIPLYPSMSGKDIKYVVNTLLGLCKSVFK